MTEENKTETLNDDPTLAFYEENTATPSEEQEDVEVTVSGGEPEETPVEKPGDTGGEPEETLKDKTTGEEPEKTSADAEPDSSAPPAGYVSQKALHEEREKRKQAVEALNKAQEFVQKMMDNQLASQQKPQVQTEPEVNLDEMDEFEKQNYLLNKKIEAMNAKIEAQEKRYAMEERERQMAKVYEQAEKADSELAKEGFPGFLQFEALVAKAMREEGTTGGPDVWKDTYKNKVFPVVKKIFAQQEIDDHLQRKEDAKKDAGLIKSPGKAPQKSAKKDSGWTKEDAAAYIQENALF